MERYQGVAEHVNAHARMRRTAREADRLRRPQKSFSRGMGRKTDVSFERILAEELQAIRQTYAVPGQVLDYHWTDEEEPTND